MNGCAHGSWRLCLPLAALLALQGIGQLCLPSVAAVEAEADLGEHLPNVAFEQAESYMLHIAAATAAAEEAAAPESSRRSVRARARRQQLSWLQTTTTLPPRGPRKRRRWTEGRYTGSDVSCEGKNPIVCTLPRASGPHRPRPRLAVLVVGLVDRFYPHGVLRHIVAPAARDGFDVDYCVLLIMQPSKMWSPANRSGDHKTWHHWLGNTFNAHWNFPQPNPHWEGIGPTMLRDQLIWAAKRNNASRLILITKQKDFAIHPSHQDHKRYFGHTSSQARPDRKGPFHLCLLRFLKIDHLWEHIPGAWDGVYHQVILTRDDLYPFADIRMSDFPDAAAIYARSGGGYCDHSDRKSWMNDQLLVVGGIPAVWYLRLYHEYWTSSDPKLGSVKSVEDFLMQLAVGRGVRFEFVPDEMLPYYLVMHTQPPERPSPVRCIRGVIRKFAKPEYAAACAFAPQFHARDCYALAR